MRLYIYSVTFHQDFFVDGAQLSLGAEEKRVSFRQSECSIYTEQLRRSSIIIAEHWKRHIQFSREFFRLFKTVAGDDKHVDFEFLNRFDAVTQRLALGSSARGEGLGNPNDDQTLSPAHPITERILLAA